MNGFIFLYMNVEAFECKARPLAFKYKFRFKIANSEQVKSGWEGKWSEVR